MSTHKSPSKKYQPKGLTILYEDKDVIVVEKPCGLLTMGTERDKSKTVHTILNDYVRKGDPRSRNRIYIVHRLDRDTSGILLFAKSEAAKTFLQEDWPATDKWYLAIVYGSLTPKEGVISSYLTENSAFSVYSTTDQTVGKLSQTEYKVLKEIKGFSLVHIHLLTGRKHQIRVQMAEKGHPLLGDKKYGKTNDSYGTLALHARSISFTHPVSRNRLTFTSGIPDFFNRLIGKIELPATEVL